MTNLDYKETLNLPKTNFPMKANLAQREPELLAFWEKMELYTKMMQKRSANKSFILNDGPPYANGDIHIGHALNKILKDIIIKSKHLSGYYAPYIPGWDCHGLPIELKVEKKVGKPGQKIDSQTFRQKCREYAHQQIDIQRKSFKRLGVFGDWNKPYITMDYKFEANIIRTLGKVIKNGHLAQGNKPVHWCTDCGSALAEAEVEYMDKISPSIDVTFKAVNQTEMASCFDAVGAGDIAVVIWTTTPWTLPANQAVAVHEKLDYVLIQSAQQRLVVAEELVSSVIARFKIEDFIIVGKCQGKKLEKLQLQHPFYERRVPIILGDHVTIDTGTGCVHTAPAHGNDDYIIGKKYNLAIDNPVDGSGYFFDKTPLVGGMHVFKANAHIIEILRDSKCLLSYEDLTHSYPHCWRHKRPLIFRATKQWFVSMTKNGLRERSLAEIKKVEWLPDWGQARIEAMVAGRPDWCISRQRTWGTPLALFVHKETGELHPNMQELIEQVAQMVEQKGIDAWFNLDPKNILSDADTKNYEKVTDTMDVWFDSGAVHFCVADQREELHNDVDLYLEGSDQHRGWFQTSMLSAVAVKQKAPYRQVLTHGFTVDANGRKMSKSLGNVVSPDKVVKTLGADVLRLWVAATDYRNELHVSDEILKRTSDAYRRIRNTARFLLANLHGFDPDQHKVELEKMLIIDRWIINRARQLQVGIVEAYDKYQFHVIYHKLHNFCVDELGSFYLDIIKDRQYTCKADGIPRRSAQTAMYYIAEALVRWIAPILSFTAEEIWKNLPGKRDDSVFFSEWFQELPILPDTHAMNDEFWNKILQVRSVINKEIENARSKGILGSSLEAEVTLYCGNELLSQLTLLKDELRFVLITSQAKLLPLLERVTNAVDTEINDLAVLLVCSKQKKCDRCWHRRADVNEIEDFPHVCKRCVENLSTAGEFRAFV